MTSGERPRACPITIVAIILIASGRVVAGESSPPELRADRVLKTLFPDENERKSASRVCAANDARCLLGVRHDDVTARKMVLALFEKTGHVVGITENFTMEGGFRGNILIRGELPRGRDLRHLQWVSASLIAQDAFFQALQGRSKAPIAYTWKPLGVHFFRSVKRKTPSAFTDGDGISYNLSGSLNTSARAVDELLFHELFHYNDALHRQWSVRVLGATVQKNLAKCGKHNVCLKPYAPTSIIVRGGTYYAFQDDNGEVAAEYAAELALRYYVEQSAMLRDGKTREAPFKCGPKENGETWAALVDEFFGGVDLVPRCP